MHIALWLGLAMTGFSATAATGPTILGVSGASGFSTTGTPTIFGGLAGASCTGPDQNTPCNSCTDAGTANCAKKPLCPCNTSRIYDGLNIVIALSNQSTDANGNTTTTSGNAIVTTTTTTTSPITLQYPNNGGTSVTLTWSQICQASTSAVSSCEGITPTTVALNIYLDSNGNGVADSGEPYTTVNFKIIDPGLDNYATFGPIASDGIGTFTPYPGDSKIYIKDPQTAANFPTLTYGSSIKQVRAFVSEENLTNAQPMTATKTQDLAVTDDGGSLAKNIVDGLSNGTRYFFRLGMLDEANNVVQYVPDPVADADAALPECATPGGAGSPECKYSATPDQVEGLLPNDFNCFVATAAYGSMLEPKLATFREFRRRVLLVSDFGRHLNLLYYRYGPYAARFIGDKPVWRAATRAALWPAFGFSWLALRVGFTNAALFAVLAIGGVIVTARRGRRPRV